MTVRPPVLLAVADEPAGGGPAAIALASLRAQQDWLREAGWELRVHSYGEVLAGIPAPPADVLCLLHFPYAYWDSEIEGKIPDLYGTGRYGTRLRDYLLEAGSALRRAVPGHLRYVNPPRAVIMTRDKAELKDRLAAAGVPTPRAFTVYSPADFTRLLAAGHRLYVKAPHASVSKGITVLSAQRWQTNYRFDGRRLAPGTPDSRGGWQFHDVLADRQAFLAALCDGPGFLVEETADAAAPWQEHRSELRITVLKGQVLAAEAWSAPVSAATAGTAGGGRRVRQLSGAGLADLPPGVEEAAQSALTAVGLGYAVHDIILDGAQRPFVVDVQAFPALGTSPRLFGELLAGLLDAKPPSPSTPAASPAGSATTRRDPAMLDSETFFAELNRDVKATDCVDNDFFRSWRKSAYTADDVQFFADQYYLYIRTFPQILAGLAHRVDDEVVRRELAKTIVSELGDEGGEIHFKLFEKACAAVGVHINGLNEASYIPEAVQLVDGIKELFLADRVEAALGGHYTIELSGLPMISSFYEGFRNLPGSHIESMDYFYLHLLVEREHVEWIQNAVAQACGTEQGQVDIRRGALRIAQLLGDFWGALYRHLEPSAVPAAASS